MCPSPPRNGSCPGGQRPRCPKGARRPRRGARRPSLLGAPRERQVHRVQLHRAPPAGVHRPFVSEEHVVVREVEQSPPLLTERASIALRNGPLLPLAAHLAESAGAPEGVIDTPAIASTTQPARSTTALPGRSTSCRHTASTSPSSPPVLCTVSLTLCSRAGPGRTAPRATRWSYPTHPRSCTPAARLAGGAGSPGAQNGGSKGHPIAGLLHDATLYARAVHHLQWLNQRQSCGRCAVVTGEGPARWPARGAVPRRVLSVDDPSCTLGGRGVVRRPQPRREPFTALVEQVVATEPDALPAHRRHSGLDRVPQQQQCHIVAHGAARHQLQQVVGERLEVTPAGCGGGLRQPRHTHVQ